MMAFSNNNDYTGRHGEDSETCNSSKNIFYEVRPSKTIFAAQKKKLFESNLGRKHEIECSEKRQ